MVLLAEEKTRSQGTEEACIGRYISKPALPYTVPHRLVQSHRAHRKVPTNTELHRVHRVCTALYRPIQTPPICTGLVFLGLAQGLYTRIDNSNAITILFQTLIAL